MRALPACALFVIAACGGKTPAEPVGNAGGSGAPAAPAAGVPEINVDLLDELLDGTRAWASVIDPARGVVELNVDPGAPAPSVARRCGDKATMVVGMIGTLAKRRALEGTMQGAKPVAMGCLGTVNEPGVMMCSQAPVQGEPGIVFRFVQRGGLFVLAGISTAGDDAEAAAAASGPYAVALADPGGC